MDQLIYRDIPSTDPRLKRRVHHDPRSRAYPVRTSGPLLSVRHRSHIPVLNQGNLGSCTGNAGIGCLGTAPFYWVRGEHFSLDQAGAVALYSEATRLDPFPGAYPPTDTGSDGLTIAKVLKAHGEISGYQHAFSLTTALQALVQAPFITGTNWYDGMFETSADGEVVPSGLVAGGHEYLAEELDVERQRIWFTNSWGPGWGLDGRFWMSWANYGRLLREQGDVTVFVPITLPAPTPTPPVPPIPVVAAEDRELADQVARWARGRFRLTSAKARRAVRTWLDAKGL